MLTAQQDFEAKQAGISAGADQYLAKPVKADEVMLWVDGLLKRKAQYASNKDRLQAGSLLIDVPARLVKVGETVIDTLTAREFDLLYALVKKRPQVLSRDAILKQVWRTIAVDNIVDTHMSHLRRKLPAEISDRLQNVPGKGFRYFDAA
jgi:two-component system response regulator MtrA